jgi:DNA ligase 1
MKPFLAATCEDLSKLKNYPYVVSPKLDGVRCLTTASGPVSRKLISVPNTHIREKLLKLPAGYDGEITGGFFDDTTSLFRTVNKVAPFVYHVFDVVSLVGGILERTSQLKPMDLGDNCLMVVVPQLIINNYQQLIEYENLAVARGYEGIMIRSPSAKYKFGRSTRKEEALMKFKRWMDDDAVIIGRTPRLKNNNPQVRDELGNAKRSKHKTNLEPQDILGALLCSFNGHNFDIGSGFDDETAMRLWKMPSEELYTYNVKFKYKALTKDKVPLFPVYLGLRTTEDC